MFKNYLKIGWHNLAWYELSKFIKFLIVVIGAACTFSVFSLTNKSRNKNEFSFNQKNDNNAKKNIRICADKSFSFYGEPISLIKWIN